MTASPNRQNQRRRTRRCYLCGRVAVADACPGRPEQASVRSGRASWCGRRHDAEGPGIPRHGDTKGRTAAPGPARRPPAPRCRPGPRPRRHRLRQPRGGGPAMPPPAVTVTAAGPAGSHRLGRVHRPLRQHRTGRAARPGQRLPRQHLLRRWPGGAPRRHAVPHRPAPLRGRRRGGQARLTGVRSQVTLAQQEYDRARNLLQYRAARRPISSSGAKRWKLPGPRSHRPRLHCNGPGSTSEFTPIRAR